MNWLESTIAAISPKWAADRERWHSVIKAYDAARTGRTRKMRRQSQGGNTAVLGAGPSLREQARWLDESHDLVTGILDTYVDNVVGPHGIQIEPQPKRRDGTIHEEFAAQIIELLRDWSVHPETRWMHDRAGMERLACLTWARDGECFGQHIRGSSVRIDHGTRLPYSIELLEPEMVDAEQDQPSANLIQGVRLNEWGRPRSYIVWKNHPGELQHRQETKEIPAERMLHLKLTRRIGQVRGVSRLATVLTRIEDLKDYEESERVAARIAAAMTAFIRRGSPDMFTPNPDGTDADGNRLFDLAPGMVWDNLMPGEEVDTIQSNRPSNLLSPFRDSMLKMVSAGSGTGYSSISKDYSGTYSSQRQQLVEQFVTYAANTAHFVGQWERPMYNEIIAIALASRQLVIPRDLDPLSVDDAEYRGPAMPWIDPQKEAQAALISVQAGFKSRAQCIRERGGNPDAVNNEILRERRQDEERDLIFSSDWRTQAQNAMTAMTEAQAEDEAA